MILFSFPPPQSVDASVKQQDEVEEEQGCDSVGGVPLWVLLRPTVVALAHSVGGRRPAPPGPRGSHSSGGVPQDEVTGVPTRILLRDGSRLFQLFSRSLLLMEEVSVSDFGSSFRFPFL